MGSEGICQSRPLAQLATTLQGGKSCVDDMTINLAVQRQIVVCKLIQGIAKGGNHPH